MGSQKSGIKVVTQRDIYPDSRIRGDFCVLFFLGFSLILKFVAVKRTNSIFF